MLLRLLKILLRCGDLELPYVQLSSAGGRDAFNSRRVIRICAVFPSQERAGRCRARRGGGRTAGPRSRHRPRARSVYKHASPAARSSRSACSPGRRGQGRPQPPRWARSARRRHEALGARGTLGIGREAEGSAGLLSGGAVATCVVILF